MYNSNNESFELKTFMDELVEEFDDVFHSYSKNYLLSYDGHVMIEKDGNVNRMGWHNCTFEGHRWFKMDNGNPVYIETPSQASEFKRLVKIYSEGVDSMRDKMNEKYLN